MVPFLCLLLLLRSGYLPELMLKNQSSLDIIKLIIIYPNDESIGVRPCRNRLGMSLTGSYPVKISAIKDLEILSRDIIRLLSQVEKKLHKGNTSTSRPSYHHSFFSSFRERERKWYKPKEETH